jgi:Helix-turn-helix domain
MPIKLRETQNVMSADNEGAAGTHRSELSLNLKPHRERSGITLERVAVVTGIGLHFLRAIEAEEFAKLPGGVYNTSYIRQYARAVGYNEAELLQYYHHCLTPPEPTDETVLPRFSQWLGGHAIRTFVHHVWLKRKGQHA